MCRGFPLWTLEYFPKQISWKLHLANPKFWIMQVQQMFLFCFLQSKLNFLVLSISTHCRHAPCSSIQVWLGDALCVIVFEVILLHLGLTQYLFYTRNIICYSSSETMLGGKALDKKVCIAPSYLCNWSQFPGWQWRKKAQLTGGHSNLMCHCWLSLE